MDKQIDGMKFTMHELKKKNRRLTSDLEKCEEMWLKKYRRAKEEAIELQKVIIRLENKIEAQGEK